MKKNSTACCGASSVLSHDQRKIYKKEIQSIHPEIHAGPIHPALHTSVAFRSLSSPQDSSLRSTIVAAVHAGSAGIISCGWFALVVRSADDSGVGIISPTIFFFFFLIYYLRAGYTYGSASVHTYFEASAPPTRTRV